MMRSTCLALLLLCILAVALPALAATEVKIIGDGRIYGVSYTGHNFTGWNNAAWTSNTPTWTRAGTRSEDPYEVWQRFRIRADFVASEAIKFRLGIKIEDTWGHGYMTAANPADSMQIYQAFLTFKWPDSVVEVTAGLQDIDLPQSSLFNASPVLGMDRVAAVVVRSPLGSDTVSVLAGFGRAIDTNQTYDPSTQVGDELDTTFLALPVALDGFKVSPWGMLAVIGRRVGDFTANASSSGCRNFAEGVLSAGSLETNDLWRYNQAVYWWGGSAFELTALDPFKLYADVDYGAGAVNDRASSRRHGWFLDFGAEYTGFDMLTPQVFAWWSTGEDSSTRNGSERIPQLRSGWGAGNSFLLDCGQALSRNSNMGVNPVGAYGVGVSLNDISFVEKLSHRLTFTYLHGNNSPRAIRGLNATLGGGDLDAGSNPYFVMGRDLTTHEYAYGINFDHKYRIYQNLHAVLETGWAHGEFQESVWGHRLVHKAAETDAWKAALGVTFKY